MLRALLPHLAAPIDRLASYALTRRSPRSRARSRAESLGPAERLEALAAIAETYGDALVAEPERFFGRPRVPSPRRAPLGRRFDAEAVDLRWPSAVEPYFDRLRERYLEIQENHLAAARLFTRGARRPAVVLVHGYRAGDYPLWERSWPIERLLETHDVALFVLPFHGVRKPLRAAVRFPGSDPRVTNEGFRQAMSDLRELVLFLRDRGAPSVGVMGMSLGGYTTALAATLEPLAFAVPFIPLASFADVAREGGRLVGTREEQDAQHAALERAHRVVSPFARPSLVAPGRVLVVAGAEDRITPMRHAERLREHFAAPLEVFPGGHLLQVGRGPALRRVLALVRETLA